MKKLMTAIGIVALAAIGVGADATVTGTWTMTVTGTPHGDMTTELVMKQEGTKVTGVFSSGHMPDMDVAGEFKDGALTLETAGDSDSKFIFDAKLKEDGTLAGYLSSSMGDMKWTAVRATEKKKDGR
jgi:hypothetical protein